MYQLFIGIDVSKQWVDAACWIEGRPEALDRFTNSVEGFEQLVRAVQQVSEVPQTEWLVCFENTGHYSKLLLHWLFEQGIPCVEENALQIARSRGMARGKSDMSDACVICAYAKRHEDLLIPSKPDAQTIVKLKKLLAQRTLFVRQRAALKNARKVNPPSLSGPEAESLKKLNDEVIATYTRGIREIESMIEELFKQEAELASNAALLQSVPGIGPVTSWYLIACTKNFSKFQCARKFACYAGIAPFPYESGSSLRGNAHVHYLANKNIKALLSNCVLAAIKCDPNLHAYYKRKSNEGKAFGVVANAIKNKIVSRAFAVIKRQSPYVVLPSYTS